MNGPKTELLIRVNGVQAAFGVEFGFASPRADEGRQVDPYRQANASFSLVQRQSGQVIRHTLIDVGMGVVPSLLDFEKTHDVHVVHEVFFTHPHFDHFAQVDWLSMALLRNLRDDQPRPTPLYATADCWKNGPQAMFGYLAERSEFHPITAGHPIPLGDLVITPFSVNHGPSAPGAVGYVAQHGDRKAIFTGDFLDVPYEDDPLLTGADVCFMDANTWHPAEWTNHQSILGNLRLIDKWKPRRVYFVHYSGYEDRNHPDDPIRGPMALARLAEEVARISNGRDLRVAEHGMVIGDRVEWPNR